MTNTGIRDLIQKILDEFIYISRKYRNTKNSPISGYFDDLTQALSISKQLSEDEKLHVTWSTGKGQWAFIPWLAIFHNDITHTTSQGVYIIYLFKEDMSGVYLTLNQGVTKAVDITIVGLEQYSDIFEKSKDIRDKIPEIQEYGFKLDNDIDLKATSKLGKSYTHSTIAHKFYKSGSLPDDDMLLKDLNVLVKAYLKYVTTQDQ